MRRGFVRASVRAGCAWRLTMEGTLDRECARLSRGLRGTGLGGLRITAWDPRPKRAPRAEPGGGDKGVRGERNRLAHEGRERPRMRATGRRSGKRAVKRGSPRSRLQRAAPSLPLPASRVSGRAKQHAKKTFAWSGTEPRGSGTRATLERAPKGLARDSVAAPGNDGARVLEWERFRSAEVDRTHRRSRRPRALPSAPRTRAT